MVLVHELVDSKDRRKQTNLVILDISIAFDRVPHQHLLAKTKQYEPWREISNNVVCATSKGPDQPAHTRRLIRAFASRLNIQ